jgi:NAD(P)-dependent dehydrogenase (short-subunit alcohol dehydrogenase family)
MAKKRVPGTVLLTGASSGIGRALAIEYARRGARVMAVSRREAELSSLCDQIGATGGHAELMVCDVADPEAARAMVTEAEAKLGSLDMVIANAGVGHSKHASRLSIEDVTRTIDVNVRGAMATLVAAIPIMLAQKHGQLVGVTSLAGRRALPGAGAYSASKAALSSFLETLRIDLAPAGNAVTDEQPGFVDTAMTKKNEFPMPFMWDPAKAARVIADRLERAPRVVAFPLPLDVLTRLSQAIPFPLYAAITRMASGNR